MSVNKVYFSLVNQVCALQVAMDPAFICLVHLGGTRTFPIKYSIREN